MSESDVAVVTAWHEALNAGDTDRLVALSSEDIELGGPRGPASGARVLREWVARAGIQMDPLRLFRRDRTVVVEQRARWNAQPSDVQTVATVFAVHGSRVTRVARHPDLNTALQAAGLDETDEVQTP